MQKLTVKMNKGQAQALIGIMVAIIIGVAVTISVINSTYTQATTTYSVTNESVNYAANGTTYALANDHLVSGSVTLTNITMAIGSGNFTVDYTDGTVKLILSSVSFNKNISTGYYNTSYQWRYGYYVTGTPKTLLGLMPVLVAVVLVLAVVGVIGIGRNKRR